MPSRTVAGLCLVLLCCLGPAGAADDMPVAPPPPAQTAAGAADPLPIQDAIDGLTDEDEATRKKAFERLNAATEADLPALEKAAQAADPEIRKQAGLLVKRLKRGEVVFQLKFPGDKAAAAVKCTVKIYAGDIQVYNNGMGGFAVQPMNAKGVAAKEIFAQELTADAGGRLSAGKLNDGDYNYVLETEDPLPRQTLSGKISLNKDTPSISLEIKRGVTVRVAVVDEAGAPVNEVTVCNVEDANLIKQMAQLPRQHQQMMLRQYTSVPTDEKGLATLEKTGLKQINLYASKPGYDSYVQEKVAAEDGATIDAKITLVKAKPVHWTLTIHDLKNKPIPGARVLAIRQADLVKLRGGGNGALEFAKIDEYIKGGAIDLGTLDDQATVVTDLPPDAYWIYAFVLDPPAVYLNAMDLNNSVKVPKSTLRFGQQPVPKP
ncbi:MAG TPA: carboxypeptidase-like regulatory domain-containing protein [Planctomycetota bacterium]|nr:carboxypeptidase-like regulatory domain-containing protein [Planctomycetota bacterium]